MKQYSFSEALCILDNNDKYPSLSYTSFGLILLFLTNGLRNNLAMNH